MDVRDKKVFIFLALLNSGGAQKILITLANLLYEKGYFVKLLAGRASGSMKELISPDLEVVDLKSKNIRQSISKLSRILRKEKPNYLISTQLHTNLAAVLACTLARNTTKLILREATTPSLAYTMTSSKKEKALFLLAKLLFRKAHRVVGVSQGVYQDIIEFYNVPESKAVLCLNPVISEKLYELANADLSHPWIKENIPVVSTLGRVNSSKDLLTLIKGFKIARQTQRLKLFIIGEYEDEDPYYQEVCNLILSCNLQDDVSFVGFDINPYRWLKHTDLFIFSTLIEGLPGALIQALALDCKIISSDFRSGLTDVLGNGKFGKVFPKGDYVMLGNLISESLAHDISYTDTERKEHLKKFHFDTAFAKYESLLV